MKLKNLSDQQLHLDTMALVQKEREVLTEILHHLVGRPISSAYRIGSLSSLRNHAIVMR